MMRALVTGEEGMRALGEALAPALRAGDAVLLSGEMGAGKSVLARAIARAFGVRGAMPSPSFTILMTYEAALSVRHFDLYRLEEPSEFYEAGLDEQMSADALSLVEWPEMTDYRPVPRLEVRIERGASEDTRLVTAEAVGLSTERAEAVARAFARCAEMRGAL